MAHPPPGTMEFGQLRVKLSQVFAVSPLSRALVNLKPVVPGHVLIVPRRRAERYSELSPAEVGDMWLLAQRVGSVLEVALGASGLTLALQDGAAAGQTIRHVHVHLIPRIPRDFEPNDDIYRRLEAERPARGEEDMAAEARKWRELLGTKEEDVA